MTEQRYVSKELSHFVGRGRPAPDQYKVLMKILRSGWLTYSSENPSQSCGEMLITPHGKISENELYFPGMVCFCDIPLQDMFIHMRKYSTFGLSFSKTFVIRHGGTPVHYIPKQAKVRTRKPLTPKRVTQLLNKSMSLGRVSIEPEEQDMEETTKADYFNKMALKYQDMLKFLNDLIKKSHAALDCQLWRKYHDDLDDLRLFLDFHVFGFLKFFDHELPDNDPDNYYFEREWRIIGSLKFEIEDVVRVLIPRGYAKQFREDFPEYFGQITFTDLHEEGI